MKMFFLMASLCLMMLYFTTANESFADVYYHKIENGKHIYTNLRPSDKGYNKFQTSSPSKSAVKPETDLEPVRVNNSHYSENYDDLINLYSEKYNLDPLLVKSIIKVESNFNPNAVSPKGATGLMQLMPGTAKMLGVRNSYNVNQNISGGTMYFRKLMDMFDSDLKLALAGYNAGENAVIKYGYNIPPYKETRHYVKKVLNHYRHLKDTTPSNTKPKIQVAFAREEKKDEKKVSFSYKETLKETGRKFQAQSNAGQPADTPAIQKPVKVEFHYSVQVASYKNFNDALRMKDKLETENKDVFIEKSSIPGSGEWFRVKVGQFTTKDNAMIFAERFKEINPDFRTAYVTN